MQTFEEQKAFFDEQWPALREAIVAGGVPAFAAKIRERADEMERRVLFMFARQGFMDELDALGGFDALIALADEGVAELLMQAVGEASEEGKSRRIDGANVISFNLAADLADCWPGDEAPREQRHFERGLQAATDCLAWREELDKPAGPRSMAWWAKGMHEISLGRADDAVASLRQALDYGKQTAIDNDASPAIDATGGFMPLINAGYLGIAARLAGDTGEEAKLLELAVAGFTAQLDDEERKDDAQFGIDQLEVVASRYLK